MRYKPPCKRRWRRHRDFKSYAAESRIVPSVLPGTFHTWHMYSIEPSNPGRASMSRSDTPSGPLLHNDICAEASHGAT